MGDDALTIDRPVALVTGGASGIGRASTTMLADDGFAVVVADLDGRAATAVAAELQDAGHAATAVEMDVRSSGSCQAALARVTQVHGRLDALVCSAGIGQSPPVPSWEQEESDWVRYLDVNLTGTWRTCAAAVPLLRQSTRGRIVCMASVAGKEGNAFLSAYSASKGGVIAFAKSLGKELVADGVLVNVVTPALIDTPMVAGGDPAAMAALAAKIPMGRLGRAGEVAAMISWLVSEACTFSTSSVFDISGGRSTY